MVNHALFDKWNESSAYVFGFWLANGHLVLEKRGKNYYKRFAITNTDEQIMDCMATIVGKTLTTQQHKNGEKLLYHIRAYSDRLFDFCYDVVNTTRKSKMLSFPSVPDNVFHHFIRGYFDGDGSIYYRTYRNRHKKLIRALVTSFTASAESVGFLDDLKQHLREFIPIGNKRVTFGKASKLTFNQYDSMLLCQWLYDDAAIFMKRKKDIWDRCDKAQLQRSTKFFGARKT